ncbi:LLM class flavin-dependent oxidoreductase [Microbacterium sp. 18062]|uniref:LLM class flavin-dependent oxidoreductase n=1 Tax=Microbacterium sp. 18062 TaxID=2681410 RepID=UPI001359FF57|nr:LLM class flavin-dependent oxidoreductase [Microbacterium sp. 18062]
MSLVALSLTGAATRGLAAGDPATLAALDEAHDTGAAHLLLLGADSLGTRRGPAPVARAIDPVAVAVARHARFPRWGFLAVAAPTRDHPYNLARRVLGAWHLTGGRLGVVLVDDDPGLPLEHGTAIPWLPGTPPGAEVTTEAARVLRALWNSWPAGTIVGDRERGVYAHVDGVRRVGHEGRYRIAGPLGTPASEHGEPVLGTADPRGEAGWAELVIRGDAIETCGAGAGRVATDGVVTGRVVTVSTDADVPREPSPHDADAGRGETIGGLRTVLGLPPRVLDLSDHSPHLKEARW